GVEIAPDESELVHTALELPDALGRRAAHRLRKLTHADELLREQRAHTMNEVVAQPGPPLIGGCVADVVPHRRSTGREDRQIGPARRLECELRLHALPDLIVADL